MNIRPQRFNSPHGCGIVTHEEGDLVRYKDYETLREHCLGATPEEIKRLKGHSAMLSQIAAYVHDFCDTEEYTTLDGVKRMAALLKGAEADAEIAELDKKYGY